MPNNTPMRLRTLRHIATGRVTTQSTNKTKRMMKQRPGEYIEITSGEELRKAGVGDFYPLQKPLLSATPERPLRRGPRRWTRADLVVAACGLLLLAIEGVLWLVSRGH